MKVFRGGLGSKDPFYTEKNSEDPQNSWDELRLFIDKKVIFSAKKSKFVMPISIKTTQPILFFFWT
jgi:hypothetical protein